MHPLVAGAVPANRRTSDAGCLVRRGGAGHRAFLPEAAPPASCGRPSPQDARIRTGKGMRRTPPTPTGRKVRPCGSFTRPAGDAPDG